MEGVASLLVKKVLCNETAPQRAFRSLYKITGMILSDEVLTICLKLCEAKNFETICLNEN